MSRVRTGIQPWQWRDEGPSNGVVRAKVAIRGELVTPGPTSPSANIKRAPMTPEETRVARRGFNRTLKKGEAL
jgi:hypothetical protein